MNATRSKHDLMFHDVLLHFLPTVVFLREKVVIHVFLNPRNFGQTSLKEISLFTLRVQFILN